MSDSEPESCEGEEENKNGDEDDSHSDDYAKKDSYPDELQGKMHKQEFFKITGLDDENHAQGYKRPKKQGPGYSMEKSTWNLEKDFLIHYKQLEVI